MMQSLLRLLSRCCYLALLLLALITGIGLYLLFVFPSLKPHAESLAGTLLASQNMMVLHAIATAFIAIVLVAAWVELLLRRQPPSPLVFNTAEGTVSISPATLARFVRVVVCGCRGVASARIHTALDGRKMNVTAWIRFTDELPVTQLATDVQRLVRQRVHDVFGFDLLRDIRIEVDRIDQRADGTRKLLAWSKPSQPDASSALSADA